MNDSVRFSSTVSVASTDRPSGAWAMPARANSWMRGLSASMASVTTASADRSIPRDLSAWRQVLLLGLLFAGVALYVTLVGIGYTTMVCHEAADMLAERGIALEPDFMVESVDGDDRKITSFDEREVDFDLLVTVPVNMGADFVDRSGLGDELNHVEVDKRTFLSVDHDNIFALGDASNIPTSKAGSVAHFQSEIVVENLKRTIDKRPLAHDFDGHANCFVESGQGKALLIDFNYEYEPLPGKFPFPGIGPFSLLGDSYLNYWGKMMFKWVYWNMMLKGVELPLEDQLTMAGKMRHSLVTE